MEQRPVPSRSPSNVVPLRIVGEFPPPLEEIVEQAIRIVLGLITLSTEALTDAIVRTLGGPGSEAEDTHGEDSIPTAGLPLLAGAALGVATGAIRWSARAATTLVRTGELVLSPVTASTPFKDTMRRLGSELDTLDARWREERPREEGAAAAFLRTLAPQIVDAVLDQVDLDEVVARRVDLDEVVERVDLDRAVDGVDLDRILGRIDIDAVAARLDVEAVVRRLDLAAIAREVVDELDLPEIIRESMGSMTTETVGGIRVQSMNADRAISRLVDRVLQRRASVQGRAEDQD